MIIISRNVSFTPKSLLCAGLQCIHLPTSEFSEQWLSQRWNSEGIFHLNAIYLCTLANCLFSLAHDFFLFCLFDIVCLVLRIFWCVFGWAEYYTRLSCIFFQPSLVYSNTPPTVSRHDGIMYSKLIPLKESILFPLSALIEFSSNNPRPCWPQTFHGFTFFLVQIGVLLIRHCDVFWKSWLISTQHYLGWFTCLNTLLHNERERESELVANRRDGCVLSLPQICHRIGSKEMCVWSIASLKQIQYWTICQIDKTKTSFPFDFNRFTDRASTVLFSFLFPL